MKSTTGWLKFDIECKNYWSDYYTSNNFKNLIIKFFVFLQMQTRSADEPMTTFVFCMECGNRWKVCFEFYWPYLMTIVGKKLVILFIRKLNVLSDPKIIQRSCLLQQCNKSWSCQTWVLHWCSRSRTGPYFAHQDWRVRPISRTSWLFS